MRNVISDKEIVSKSNNIFISKGQVYVSEELVDAINTALRNNAPSKDKPINH